jgi:integrase
MSARDTRRVGSAERQDLVACWIARYASRWCRTDGASRQLSHCTEKVYYLPSQPQRRGISYAESKTDASPPNTVNCTVRKYLTGREIEKLMDYARKHSRYGHRDSTMVLVTYRHGLRASEVCDLQWHQVELDHGRMHVRRAKNGTPSVHPIRGDEIRALRKLRRESPTEAYVFVTERGGPMSTIGFHHLIQRLGKAARMPFPLHPHMLRHACGYKLANDGHDTRALQHYLGHKNIQHTVRYTELSPDRFRDFWRY